jgi:hypothetical protein
MAGGSRALALVLGACAVLLSACGQTQMLARLSSAEDRALCVKLIEKAQADASSSPTGQQDIPTGPGSSLTLLDTMHDSAQMVAGPTVHVALLAYEVDGGGRSALVRISLQHIGKATQVTGFSVTPLEQPIFPTTRFNLAGKSALQYLFLALSALSVGFSLGAAVLACVSKDVLYRWAWALGCLVGVGRFTIDWATDTISISPMSAEVLSIFAGRFEFLGDWQIGFGIPIFAILFVVSELNARSARAAKLRRAA